MANTLILWVLIIFNALLLLGILVFGFIFTIRKKTLLTIIMPDKTVSTKNFFRPLSKTEKVGDGEYFIDEKCLIRSFWGYKLYYFFGNPNPIAFDFDKNIPHDIGTKSQDIKTFHESDLIKKLFATESLENIIMYICIGIGLVCLATLILVVTKSTPQVTLENNQNNTQVIINAVRMAIRSNMSGV